MTGEDPRLALSQQLLGALREAAHRVESARVALIGKRGERHLTELLSFTSSVVELQLGERCEIALPGEDDPREPLTGEGICITMRIFEDRLAVLIPESFASEISTAILRRTRAPVVSALDAEVRTAVGFLVVSVLSLPQVSTTQRVYLSGVEVTELTQETERLTTCGLFGIHLRIRTRGGVFPALVFLAPTLLRRLEAYGKLVIRERPKFSRAAFCTGLLQAHVAFPSMLSLLEVTPGVTLLVQSLTLRLPRESSGKRWVELRVRPVCAASQGELRLVME